MAKLGYIQIIRQCNQSCLFCSSPETGQIRSLKDVVVIVDDYIKEKIDGVVLTGGEPTLHPKLNDILKYCQNKGLEVRLITNAQKLSDYEYLKKLVLNGLDLVHISVHSINPKVQDLLSNNKGSLKRIVRSLVNAKKLKLPVYINMVINSLNCKTIDKNINFFIRSFPEIKHFIINNIDAEENRASENKFLVPKFADIKKSLNKALDVLSKSNKTFRIEMVPLCYMSKYADCSTETRKIVKDEARILNFLDKRNKPHLIQNKGSFRYDYAPQCNNCTLKTICAGVHGLNDYFDSKELIPQTMKPDIIINKILNNG
ncbi:radical SAM protein [Patescibacteria group bacterium]